MGRLVLATLVAVMLALTGYIAYSSTAGTAPDSPAVATDSVSPCCTKSAASCCSQTEETPACCKDKANCCETKGEAGTCCQNPSKAEAIAGAAKKVDEQKKD